MKFLKAFFRVLSIFTVLFGVLLTFCYVSRETDLVIQRYFLKTEKFQEGFSYHALVLSDYHNHGLEYRNESLLDAIESENPDALFLLGDMVDSHTNSKDLHVLDSLASFIEKKGYPAYFVSGNHEEDAKKEIRDASYDIYRNRHITILDENNQKASLKENDGVLLNVFGFRDPGYWDKDKSGLRPGSIINNQAKTMELERKDFNVLLSHKPSYFEVAKEKGFDLTLSGHTHAGQVDLWGYPLASIPWTKYEKGSYLEDGKELIISNGLGVSYDLPFRFHCPYTLVSVTILGTR